MTKPEVPTQGGDREPATRRERVRAATYEEIRTVGRRLLVDEGASGVTLRAIARQMGMTAPALYRYYDSRELLLKDLCATFFDELSDKIEAECAAVGEDDAEERFVVACRTFRRWAFEHPAEFGHLFGSPIPGVMGVDTYVPGGIDPANSAHLAGIRFGGVFMRLFVALWRNHPFPVLADDEIAPELAAQLDLDLPEAEEVPRGARLAYLSGWVSLYGHVTMEVFGHLGWALSDAEPFFEHELTQFCAKLGIQRIPRPDNRPAT